MNTAPGDEPPRLGALEAQVMDALWDHGPSTIRGVIAHLPSDPAYTTIATVLTNLDRKHLVASRKERHSTLYEACASREEHVASVMNHALDASKDRAASILRFMDNIPESDLALLRDYLQRRDDGSPA